MDEEEQQLVIEKINEIRRLLIGTGLDASEILSHIANILIDECQGFEVSKEKFLELMEIGWDCHYAARKTLEKQSTKDS